MKRSLQLTFIFVVLSILNGNAICSKAFIQSGQQQDTTVIHVENEYYVSAKSCLNYRDTPSGGVLGKSPLNKQLKVVYKSNVFDQITDNHKTIHGEWIGKNN